MRRHNRIVYDLVRSFNAASLRRNWRLDIEGAEHLDVRGPAILAFNHGHIVDGTVFIPLVRRRIRFLVDHRALRVPLLGQILGLMDVIPVHVQRPEPTAALTALRTVQRGRLLGVFPEAKAKGDGMIPARRGVAWLADRLAVPVIPVAMWGVSAFNRPFDVYVRRVRPRITVNVGEPLSVMLPDDNRRDALQPAADAVMLTIAERLPRRYRGVYAEGTEAWHRAREAVAAGWVAPRSPAASTLRFVSGPAR
jgi:1-acyl-sn-glycerol-3-phosphate acyltransferase